jgi:nucleotide-binding universal stress UspA family protein
MASENINRVIVPVQGAPDDDAAVQLACLIAKQNKAQVYAVYVIEVPRTLPLEADLPDEERRAEQALQRAEIVAEDVGLEIEGELLQARFAGAAVVDEAVDKQADLIIIGLPYRTRFGEFSLGGTSSYVLKNAPCRVWLCRDPKEE